MPILRILCYDGSLVTRTDVSLTTSKFNPLIFFYLIKHHTINTYGETEVQLRAFLPSELVQAVTILLCIWKVPGSNLDRMLQKISECTF
jgi:hypothetical protein